jgi:hypothetical protein
MEVIFFDGEIKEAYLSAQDDRPQFVVAGADAEQGPLEVLVGGVGLQLDGITIGTRVRVKVTPL